MADEKAAYSLAPNLEEAAAPPLGDEEVTVANEEVAAHPARVVERNIIAHRSPRKHSSA